jgi:tetratricopeptide (TPR) repeat protein
MKKAWIPVCIVLLLHVNLILAQTQPPHCAATKVTDVDWYTSGKKAPLLDGLDGISFTITTSKEMALKYFRQGLMLSYGFNHAEAARSFYEAIRIDSNCAMCYWGYALVLGPNYNGGMEADNYDRAYRAAQEALSKSAACTPKEKDLIAALTKRYSKVAPEDRSPLDTAYANAMRQVYEKYKGDVDVVTLFAESLMDLHPWDLYDRKGNPKTWTPEIVATLKAAIALSPRHAGANHFYIHAVEASRAPQDAEASADLLRDLVPGAGHLVHMPSHIYIHTGRYHEGSLSNQDAVKADKDYFTSCHAQGVYPLAYFPHNYHFLAACATLEGNGDLAMDAARKVADYSDKELMAKPEWATLQHYSTIPYFVAVKFGRWDEILKMPEPELNYPKLIYHYARGFAGIGKGDPARAEEELNLVKMLLDDPTLKELTIWGINSLYSIAEIAQVVLEGELRGFQGNYPDAISLLNRAVMLEDGLNYDEPPDWFFSVRHNLGALLIEAGQYQDALIILQEDLAIYPANGWALAGLSDAAGRSLNKERAAYYKKQFDEAWIYADTPIVTSRIGKKK